MGKAIIPDYNEFDILKKDAEYIQKQIKQIMSANPRMKGQYEKKALLFLENVLKKKAERKISISEAGELFSYFVPFTFEFFGEQLSSLVCRGSLLSIPMKRSPRLSEEIKKMRKNQ